MMQQGYVGSLSVLQQLSDKPKYTTDVCMQVPFMSFPEVEAVLADAIKFGYVQVQIDHRMGTLHFGGANLRNEGMAGHLSNIAGACLHAFCFSVTHVLL